MTWPIKIKVCSKHVKFYTYLFYFLVEFFFDTALTYIVGHGLNSLFCDCSGHVEIDMTLLHSGMFGKCEIGHGPSIILLML
jgi:hypothetical protein